MLFRKSFFSSRKSRNKRKKRFSSPRQVEDYWNFYRHDVYIEKPGRRLPGWLLPLLALLLIIALLFWAVPAVISRIQLFDKERQDGKEEPPALIYSEDIWTVGKPVADIFTAADIKAERESQVLYNEPVKVLPDETGYGFRKVKLADGTEGFMLLSDLVDSRDSIEPAYYQYKLVVGNLTKRVMSHSSRGTLLVEVMLGTVLFADYSGDGIYRVHLPGGDIGWISDEGVVVLGPEAEIAVPDQGGRYFTSTALLFNQITVLENGQSIMGISPAGIIRLAAFVNGVNLPRGIDRISQSGFPVGLIYNQESGLVEFDSLAKGDILVLDSGSGDEPPDLAVYVDIGQILYAREGHTSIRLYDLTNNEDLWQRVTGARRLFP